MGPVSGGQVGNRGPDSGLWSRPAPDGRRAASVLRPVVALQQLASTCLCLLMACVLTLRIV